MRWHRDSRYRLGGYWECYPKLKERKHRYWHSTGWAVLRRKHLRARRERILTKLDELRQEAEDSRDS